MKAITESGRRSRDWLKRQGLQVRPWLLGSVLAGVLQTLCIMVQMGLIAWLVHAVLVRQEPIQDLLWLLMVLVLAIGLRAISQAAQERCGQHASVRVRQQARDRKSVV